ncbi:HalOD1 output domain-containing protein [Natrinema salinisoli]|uniref:HalOD1 output domain-containing protein n=1 Tax=Natrinema salinisoli TaxID=2878535 RepID=UPI001CF031FC|nr:HalOD1 output domain-containing protein [Natrinema salinisoli]
MPSRDDGPARRDADYVTTFDPADDRASQAIVHAVAAVIGAEPGDLSPLYDVVEPDALDSFVEHAQRVGDTGTHQVWFTYEGVDVGVRSDGEIRIRDATSTAS